MRIGAGCQGSGLFCGLLALVFGYFDRLLSDCLGLGGLLLAVLHVIEEAFPQEVAVLARIFLVFL